MTIAPEPPVFDQALYAASLAYYGLPATYARVFATRPLLDPETQQPRTNEQGEQAEVLMACSARAASRQGQAVWVQVNRTLDDAARTGKGHPKKAKNTEIASLANVTLDFEYPREPGVAHRIGLALADFLVVQGLAETGLPVEDSGAGCHIVLPLPPIELSPKTAERWNQAVASVVKTWILPEFVRLCAQEQVTMDLCGYDISRVLSVPGTWRPTSPKKPDCAALQQGYLRRWLPPYIGTVYPVRRESARLAELIREAYESPPPPRTPSPAAARLAHEDPKTWLEVYAAAHPCTDRSACFQRLVSAVYLKFGEETVHACRDDIHALSGEKYNGRLEVELERSLARAAVLPLWLRNGSTSPFPHKVMLASSMISIGTFS